jgi:hypothetical protein
MGKKKLCKACERRKLKLAEQQLMESFLCLFFDDVFCPHSNVVRENRIDSVCLNCVHYERFEREMDEEEERDAEFVEAVRKDSDAYLRGGIL